MLLTDVHELLGHKNRLGDVYYLHVPVHMYRYVVLPRSGMSGMYRYCVDRVRSRTVMICTYRINVSYLCNRIPTYLNFSSRYVFFYLLHFHDHLCEMLGTRS